MLEKKEEKKGRGGQYEANSGSLTSQTSLPLRQHGASSNKHGVRLMSYIQWAYRHSIRSTTGSLCAVRSTLLPTAAARRCTSLNATASVPPMSDDEDVTSGRRLMAKENEKNATELEKRKQRRSTSGENTE